MSINIVDNGDDLIYIPERSRRRNANNLAAAILWDGNDDKLMI